MRRTSQRETASLVGAANGHPHGESFSASQLAAALERSFGALLKRPLGRCGGPGVAAPAALCPRATCLGPSGAGPRNFGLRANAKRKPALGAGK